jgi:hypothetical protein
VVVKKGFGTCYQNIPTLECVQKHLFSPTLRTSDAVAKYGETTIRCYFFHRYRQNARFGDFVSQF